MDGTGDHHLSEIGQAQKPNIKCLHSFVEPRPKMMVMRRRHEYM
jgi:hypothetical protein